MPILALYNRPDPDTHNTRVPWSHRDKMVYRCLDHTRHCPLNRRRHNHRLRIPRSNVVTIAIAKACDAGGRPILALLAERSLALTATHDSAGRRLCNVRQHIGRHHHRSLHRLDTRYRYLNCHPPRRMDGRVDTQRCLRDRKPHNFRSHIVRRPQQHSRGRQHTRRSDCHQGFQHRWLMPHRIHYY